MKDVIKENAIRYSRSATLETEIFKKYAQEFFKLGPRQALENLRGSNPTPKTVEVAKDFHKDVLVQYGEKIEDAIKASDNSPEARKEILLMEFFRDYLVHSDHNRALRTAMGKVEKDPEISGDTTFIETLANESKKLEPKERQGVKGFEITPSEGVLFSVRNTGRRKYMHKLSPTEVKKLITNSLQKHVGTLLQSDFGVNEKDAKSVDVDFEVNAVMNSVTMSPAVALAKQDVTELSNQAFSLADRTQKAARLRGLDTDFSKKKYDEALKKIKKEPLQATSTELMQIFRQGIMYSKKYGAEVVFDSMIEALKIQEKKEVKSLRDTSKIKDLSEIVKRHKTTVGAHLSTREGRDLMADAYSVLLKFDRNDQKIMNNIHHEVKCIMRSESVPATIIIAVEEIERKKSIVQQWNVYSKFVNQGEQQQHAFPKKSPKKAVKVSFDDDEVSFQQSFGKSGPGEGFVPPFSPLN